METVVINQIKDQSYTMKESLRALKTSISFSGKGVKSILFTSSVPNEGKTTVVMDLARSMADSKKSVLVVDTDMRKSGPARHIRLPEAHLMLLARSVSTHNPCGCWF